MTSASHPHAPADYLLHLADNALVLGQRNAEWCGHGPILEEDIALTNISLDLVGQARLLYQHAAAVLNAAQVPDQGAPQASSARGGTVWTEDRLAYFRDARAFRNYTLLELPHHGPLAGTAVAERDYATTIVRNFLYSQLMLLLWAGLQASRDAQLAAIAGKSVKEVRYHLRHGRDWLVRLGDGTEVSHARTQAAVDHLLPYTEEFWTLSPTEKLALEEGTGIDPRALQAEWAAALDAALAEAALRRPATRGFVPRGKEGLHSEHLGFLLAEMQGLARQHPGATW